MRILPVLEKEYCDLTCLHIFKGRYSRKIINATVEEKICGASGSSLSRNSDSDSDEVHVRCRVFQRCWTFETREGAGSTGGGVEKF